MAPWEPRIPWAICEARAWLRVLSLLPAAGRVAGVAGNAALAALARGAQPQLALQLLQELPVERWSAVTLNTLMPWVPMDGSDGSDGSDGMEWDPELWQRSFGIQPNLMSYNEAALLSECLGVLVRCWKGAGNASRYCPFLSFCQVYQSTIPPFSVQQRNHMATADCSSASGMDQNPYHHGDFTSTITSATRRAQNMNGAFFTEIIRNPCSFMVKIHRSFLPVV